jgi:hypothetical protein
MHRAKVRKYEKLDIPDNKERMDGVPRKRLEYRLEEEEKSSNLQLSVSATPLFMSPIYDF